MDIAVSTRRGSPGTISVKLYRKVMDRQGTKWRRNIAENFNRLSRAHERYRQTTDGRTTTYIEHELEFTFAKNYYGVHERVWWKQKCHSNEPYLATPPPQILRGLHVLKPP